MKKIFSIWGIIVILAIVGEIKCISKAIKCDWQPIGKAEIIYTGSALCGLGAIVGWFNIEDVPTTPQPTEQAVFNSVLPKPVYIPVTKNFAYRRM